MEEIYAALHDATETGVEIDEASEIRSFFAGQTIFLTGCTGFLGKLFVEKLLRSCPDIKRLYVLVRPKKQPVEERMKMYFENEIFERMKRENPNYLSKISTVRGSLMEENLGLSDSEKDSIVQETTLIYHNASNVKFDEKINIAIRTNVLGTKFMLKLAGECKKLLAFTYISTAYSHCYQQHIEEKFYPPPGDMKMIMDVLATAESNPRGLEGDALKEVLGRFPNAYVFTKSTAESLVEECAKTVPFACVVFRPSIVTSTYLEPIRGWCGNTNGPAGMLIGTGVGFVHAGYKCSYPNDLVPADMCTNAMIAVPWDAVVNKKPAGEGIIYNYGSSATNPISLRTFGEKAFVRGCDAPSIHMMAPYSVIHTNCIWYFWLLHLTVHLSVALFADCVLLYTGGKPKMVSMWTLWTKNIETLHYYSTGNWRIYVHRTTELWNRMNRRDSQLFYCDLRNLSWDDYTYAYWAGLRVYVLKDPMSTTRDGLRRHHFFELVKKVFNYATRIAILYFVGRWLFSVLPTHSEYSQNFSFCFSILAIWYITFMHSGS